MLRKLKIVDKLPGLACLMLCIIKSRLFFVVFFLVAATESKQERFNEHNQEQRHYDAINSNGSFCDLPLSIKTMKCD